MDLPLRVIGTFIRKMVNIDHIVVYKGKVHVIDRYDDVLA